MAARKRFTEEQIVSILKKADQGASTQDLCREYNVSSATLYKWKGKYAGMEISDLRKMKGLEDENRRLKQMVANQALDIEALRALSSKNFLSPK
jgi:putative transposase